MLTVVDTPGFADTEGPSRDRVTIQRITEFLQYEQQWGSARIDAIVFVINSTDCRHGLQTIYEYDQVRGKCVLCFIPSIVVTITICGVSRCARCSR